MAIKPWVNPPSSLSLSELQLEFGCVPAPPTTTTTLPLATTSTTSTSTTSTSTTSTTTTLAPNNYDPVISFVGITSTLKSGSSTIYEILSFVKGSNYQYRITGAPPGAALSIAITYSDSTTATVTGTIDGSGNFTSVSDSSTGFPLGVLSAVATITPLVGQVNLNGNTRTLEVTVVSSTTTSTSTSTSTSTTSTTTVAGAATYSIVFLDSANQVVTSIAEGSALTIALQTANVPNGTVIAYNLAGLSAGDFVGSPSLSGTFTVGGVTSTTVTLAQDLLTEGTETLTVTLTPSGGGSVLSTRTITIIDSSTTQFGTAYLVSGAGIETLTGSATLPAAPVKLMFRLIGGGGSGGGADDINGYYMRGGSGMGGGVILGMVQLPATSGPKILKGGIGFGGLPASSNLGSNGQVNDFGAGGSGYSFPLGVSTSSRGGNGASDGPRGVSGRGGGGGGSTALFVTIGSSTVGIASSGGGGGGGGGSRGIVGGHAAVGSGAPFPYQSVANLNGSDAIPDSDDGGGGGGGGGGAGAAGSPGRDNNRGNIRAQGGVSGRPVQNTSMTVAAGDWSKFEYYEPRSTAIEGALSARNSSYTGFLNTYGVWENYLETPSFNVTAPVYFSVSGTYNYTFNADNLGSFSVDGSLIASVTNQDQHKTSDLTGSFTTTIGWKNVTVTGSNTGGPGSIGLVITNSGQIVFSTLDLTQNRNGAVEESLSGNEKFYGYGGSGSNDISVASTSGSQGAIALYWTTDTSAAWNVNLLPKLPLPTFGFSIPSSVSIEGASANLDFYINGKLGTSPGYSTWSNTSYEALGSLFQLRVDYVSGDNSGLNPTISGGTYAPKATWMDWSFGVPLSVGYYYGGYNNSVVARIQIRRKSDNVVVLDQNVTFSVTVPYDPMAGGGGGN